jgi:hypothetical protein
MIEAHVLAINKSTQIAQVSSGKARVNTAAPPMMESGGITCLVLKRSAIVPASGEKSITGIVPTINKAATAAGPWSFSLKTRVKMVSSVPSKLNARASAIA